MIRSRPTLGLLFTGLVAVILLAAWLGPRLLDHAQGAREVAADAPLSEQCDDVPASASRMTLVGADGRALGGASVGPPEAATAVVLRHGASQTLCDWLPWADEIADAHGVRVLLFDRRGQGSSPGEVGLAQEPDDLVAAVERADDDGADRIVLVASSMGNAVMFSTLDLLAAVDQSICAAVSISPVLTASPLAPGSPLRLPATTWITWEAANTGIAGTAERLVADADRQGVETRTLGVDTDDHSLALVKNHDEVRDFVSEGVGSCA